MTAEGGDTPSSFYNFFIGRELNPRIYGFDLKHFAELYPNLIGWLLIDLGMVAKQQQVGEKGVSGLPYFQSIREACAHTLLLNRMQWI